MTTPDPTRKRHLPTESPLSAQKRARNTLSKPFRSPLISRKAHDGDGGGEGKTKKDGEIPETPVRVSRGELKGEEKTSPSCTHPISFSPVSTPSPFSTPTTRVLKPALPSPAKSPSLAVLDRLQKNYTALLLKLRTERAKLETMRRALALEEREDEGRKLRDDTEVWRGCARGAAEWMFGVAKERVGRFGGVWERKKEWEGWDEEEKRGHGSEDGEEGEYADLGGESQEVVVEKKKDEEGLQEFTMEKMLGMLGVERNMLRWDEALGKWVD